MEDVLRYGCSSGLKRAPTTTATPTPTPTPRTPHPTHRRSPATGPPPVQCAIYGALFHHHTPAIHGGRRAGPLRRCLTAHTAPPYTRTRTHLPPPPPTPHPTHTCLTHLPTHCLFRHTAFSVPHTLLLPASHCLHTAHCLFLPHTHSHTAFPCHSPLHLGGSAGRPVFRALLTVTWPRSYPSRVACRHYGSQLPSPGLSDSGGTILCMYITSGRTA